MTVLKIHSVHSYVLENSTGGTFGTFMLSVVDILEQPIRRKVSPIIDANPVQTITVSASLKISQ